MIPPGHGISPAADRTAVKAQAPSGNGGNIYMISPAVTQKDIAAFARDGAVVLRGILTSYWVDIVQFGIEEIRTRPSELIASEPNTGVYARFFTDLYGALRNERLKQFVFESPAASVASQLLQSTTCCYVLDQVFYKDIGYVAPSDWHQDTPYFNFEGNDMARVWVCCDPAPRSVALRVVRGSHLWNVTYRPGTISQNDSPSHAELPGEVPQFDRKLPPMPDIDAHRGSFDILEWDIEPGDVVVFHPSVIHGAGGKVNHTVPRRAFGVLLGGDDARYLQRPGYTVPNICTINARSLVHGPELSKYPEIFPRVWPRSA
jgi:ectoine hydroxylase-related dioxygenase (phytanoyl-CoA dioxygenase family)